MEDLNLNLIKMKNYFVAPFEVGVLGEDPIAQLALEEFVDVGGQYALEQDVQMIEIILGYVLVGEIGYLAERTHSVHDAAVADLSAEVGASASAAAAMDAVKHRHHLNRLDCSIIDSFMALMNEWIKRRITSLTPYLLAQSSQSCCR